MNAHKSVLLQEIIDGLNISKGDTVVDATTNGGGMSAEIAKRFGNGITLICLDADSDALQRAKENIEKFGNTPTYINGNFGNLEELLREAKTTGFERILFDIGLSSDQLETSGRGFTFKKNEPLLMTFKKNPGPNDLTAKDIVNTWDEENIETIIRSYGDERFARKIARAIVEAREKKKIETSGDLAAIIEKTIRRTGKIHPATKTFQALRITVNDEIGNLKKGITQGFELLKPNGRLAVISFHSIEDRFVKNFIKEKATAGEGRAVTKKPIKPSDVELKENPRARSAKLRIIEKV